jgi:hypothetical protein
MYIYVEVKHQNDVEIKFKVTTENKVHYAANLYQTNCSVHKQKWLKTILKC